MVQKQHLSEYVKGAFELCMSCPMSHTEPAVGLQHFKAIVTEY
jgi:hypothetical protein